VNIIIVVDIYFYPLTMISTLITGHVHIA